LSKIQIGRQFCGPPNSGNGGYVCGVLASGIEGPATAVLRAPIPLDADLRLVSHDAPIGESAPAVQPLPDAPVIPSPEAARAAGARFMGLTQRTHPICFTCGPERSEGDGLRVFPGQLEGADAGIVACAWTPHAAFADAQGTVATEVVWAALDCPGFFAWVEKAGRHGALLGTMTGEVLIQPRAGEEYVVVAWPIGREGRKETAGVALFDRDGRLMARGHQVWIVMGPRPPMAEAATEAATA
jgi:hypothetical protein